MFQNITFGDNQHRQPSGHPYSIKGNSKHWPTDPNHQKSTTGLILSSSTNRFFRKEKQCSLHACYQMPVPIIYTSILPEITASTRQNWNSKDLWHKLFYSACLDTFVWWWFSLIMGLIRAVCTRRLPLSKSNCSLSNSWQQSQNHNDHNIQNWHVKKYNNFSGCISK